MHKEVRNLFVVDSNDQNALVHLVPAEGGPTLIGLPLRNFNPAPQWGNLFSYYLADASDALPGRAYKMARAARPDQKDRAIHGRIVREEPHLRVPLVRRESYEVRRLRTSKLARQGEFDNIHMAPRMFLEATHARFKTRGDIVFSPKTWTKIDPDRFKLREIAMAPLCAHDCFHSHWRWADGFSAKSVLGWDAEGPHRAAGAPMIPPHHSLEVLLPQRNEIIYSETAHGVRRGRQEVFFHFGAAYGLASDGMRSLLNMLVSPAAGGNKGAPWEFGIETLDGEIKEVPDDTWAVMYWNFRYYMIEGALPESVAGFAEYHDVIDLLGAMES